MRIGQSARSVGGDTQQSSSMDNNGTVAFRRTGSTYMSGHHIDAHQSTQHGSLRAQVVVDSVRPNVNPAIPTKPRPVSVLKNPPFLLEFLFVDLTTCKAALENIDGGRRRRR
ncbi:hypothetical protein SAMN04487869_1246 [Marinobacter sp. DSM 26671]|jgi:hypothetical protein|nr:hypothetical protein SAMN04487869_1246 [Marinobacter sp. DSM 26671]